MMTRFCATLSLASVFLATAHGDVRAADCGDTVAACACGDTVVADLTLGADLVCAATFTGTALSVGADGVTIDGQGFAIRSGQADTVIDVGTHSSVTVKDIDVSTTGSLPDRKFGIVIGAFSGPGAGGNGGGTNNILMNVTANGDDPQGRGIVLWPGSNGNQIRGCTANGKKRGIYLLQADNNIIDGNVASFGTPINGEQDAGIEIIGGSGNTMTNNMITGRFIGIAVEGTTTWGATDTNVVQDNTLSGNRLGVSQATMGAGNSYIDNDLSMSADVALSVNGDSSVIISGNNYRDSATALALSNATGISLTDIAAADLGGLTGNAGVRLTSIHDSTVSNLTLDGGSRIALWLKSSTGNTLTDITSGGRDFGIYLTDGSDSNTITNANVAWAGTGLMGNGITISASSDNVVDGGTATGRVLGVSLLSGGGGTTIQSFTSTGNNWGIQHTGGGSGTRLLNNNVSNATGVGIGVDGDSAVILTGNTYDNAKVGLFLSNVTGMTLQTQQLAAVTDTSLRLSNVTDSQISGLQLAGRYGARLVSSSDNTFVGITATANAESPLFGIEIDADSANNTFSDVTVEDYATGVMVSGNNTSVTCSRLLDNSTTGLDNVGNAVNTVIRSTQIIGNGVAGVRNSNPQTQLDAQFNFWGAADGPAPAGAGDVASDGVNAASFLDVFIACCDVDSDCDDSVFCNGAETCAGPAGCTLGIPPADDGVACTVDSCNEQNATVANLPSDALCDDTLFCNGTEVCDAGSGCVAGEALELDDGVACTLDSCDEALDLLVHEPVDASCDNGLFCDGAETCDLGLGCVAGAAPTVSDNVDCTVDSCDESLDAIVNTPMAAACDNGLFCDGVESCDAELGCVAGEAPVVSDGVDCTADSCDEEVDAIVHTPVAADCDNGLFCDGTESCDAQLGCVAGTEVDVDDGIACTSDSCDEDADAVVNSVDDALCDNGVFCDGVEICDATAGCEAGVAVDCDDGNVCTLDACDSGADACLHEPIADCCASDDDCDDAEVCTLDTCDVATGQCQFDPVALDGDGCGDLPCTVGRLCDAGSCGSGEPRVCDDDNPCTTDSCDPAEGCQVEFIDGCCAVDDDCADLDPCTVGQCDVATGDCQQSTADANGSACDDDDGCTVDDVCGDGVCEGVARDCDDNDACTTDACTDGACSNEPVAGCCVTSADCDDGDACTDDVCDSDNTCINAAIGTPECGACLPNESTTMCQAGELVWLDACGEVSGVADDCDDGDPCTLDGCDPTGCVNTFDDTKADCVGELPIAKGGACQGGGEGSWPLGAGLLLVLLAVFGRTRRSAHDG